MRTTTPTDESRVTSIALAKLTATRRLAAAWRADRAVAAADASTSDRERAVTAASTTSRTDPEQTTDVDGRGGDPDTPGDGTAHAWLAVLPFVATLLGVAVGAVS